MEKWRLLRIVVFIHKVNQHIWLIPSVNVSYILKTSFVYSFFILNINLTHFVRKNVIFANFILKSERCRRSLAYIFQTNNRILMKLVPFAEWNDKSFAVYRFKISRNLTILQTYQNLNIVSDFKSGDRTGFEVSQTGLFK